MRTFPQTTYEMADLIEANVEPCGKWKRGLLLEWVQWFVNNNRYCAVTDGGELVGVALVRLVDSEADCHEDYRDTGGPVCYVEVAVSKHPVAMKSIFTIIARSFGKNVKKVAWVRHKYGERVTVVDMGAAKRRYMRN
jgi:hypothetical protein